MTFKDLGLIAPILKAIDEEGYINPTPIQAQSIPILLKKKDLLGCAQTGTGKTAAFAIPILQHLTASHNENQKYRKKIKALVITPTRELAIQIDESFKTYGKHTKLQGTVIFGGVKQTSQVNRLKQGVDLLVATPGRLLDLINQGFISLRDVEYFVLDEADQMLDMGFIHDIKKVIALLPHNRQSLFFSATMAPAIVSLSQKILGNPERVTVKPQQTTAEKVEQGVYFVSKTDKIKLLAEIIKEKDTSTLVFSRTKHGANKIVKLLAREDIKAEAIHGNKSQTARQKALNSFKEGTTKVLVATDIAARGIDVEELSLVVNYDLPNIPESYVHRIGRTGRAKASGIALSFCDAEERSYLRDIQKLIRQEVPVISDHDYVDTRAELPPPKQGGNGGGRPQNNKPKNNSRNKKPNNQSGNPSKKKFNWRKKNNS